MVAPIKTVILVIKQIDEPCPGVKRYVLEDEDKWPLPPFMPGAHIDVHLGAGLVRTYSLCNEPSNNRQYVIAVKREASGRGGSKYIHDQLKIGDHIGVSLPRGGIRVDDRSMNIFVAGGVGITPFISAIRDLEVRGKANYVLHWSNMGEPSLIDMLAVAQTEGRVRLYNTLVEPLPDLEAIVHSCGDSARAYCCGPAGMLDAFEQAVSSWPEERKHVERFTAPKLVANPNAAPFTVVLAKSKKEAVVQPEVGLLRTLEAMNADISVSCGGGICGACRTRWLEGPPVHRDRVLSQEERESNVIVCVAECTAPRLVLDL